VIANTTVQIVVENVRNENVAVAEMLCKDK